MPMDSADVEIMEKELSATIGKAIGVWSKKNGIDEPVSVTATISHPSCYVDELGVAHTGNLIVCNVSILSDEDYDDDDDY